MGQQHNLTGQVDIAARGFDAVKVDCSALPGTCIVKQTDVNDPGVDVVLLTVDGLEGLETVTPTSRLYVLVKNTTGSPVSASLAVIAEELDSQPPE